MKWFRASGLVLGSFLITGLACGNEDQPLKAQEKDKSKPAEKGQPAVSVDDFLKQYDKSKSGFLEKKDLPRFAQNQFDALDDNKDGKLSREELQKHKDKVQCWTEIAEQRRMRLLAAGTFLGRVAVTDQPGRTVVQSIYDVFQKIDRDFDGKIDRDEWEATCQAVCEWRANAMLDRQGVGHDGKVSKDQARGRLRRHFEEYDLNHDGFVDRDELMKAFGGKAQPAKNAPRKVENGLEKPAQKVATKERQKP